MTRYTYQELERVLNRSNTTIDRKVKKYGLKLEKDYVNGRKVKLVTLSNDELEALKLEIQQEDERKTSAAETKVNTPPVENYKNTSPRIDNGPSQPTPQQDQTVQEIVELSRTVRELAMQSSKTSEALGEYKQKFLQLEDLQKSKKDDAEYWQGQYHELKSTSDELVKNKVNEINALNKQIEEQQKIIKDLEKQVEDEKKRPFWKRNVV